MSTMKVLDHGYVKLVHYCGSDHEVAMTARTSTGKRDSGHSEKLLIQSLAKKGHTTPFEACFATFDVKAPLFVIRQWQRHRTQSYVEKSARYTTDFGEFYIPERVDGKARILIATNSAQALKNYAQLLEDEVPAELARLVLPVNLYTEMRASANLWNWARFLRLRMAKNAQYEIRQYANALYEQLLEAFPISVRSLCPHPAKY